MRTNLFIWGLCASAGFLAASCSNELEPPAPAGGNVNFTVSLPGTQYGTRTFANGLTAENLKVAVYDAATDAFVTETTAQFDNSLQTTVSLNLANGRAYKVAFFAVSEAADGNAYTFSAADKKITVDYTKMTDYNSADSYDCFYTLAEVAKVTEPVSTNVVLNRPVAQINWGTNDLEEPAVVAAAAYGANAARLVTKVTTKAYTEFSLLDGDVVASSEGDVEFAYAARPAGETFPVDDYNYLSMQYIFVPKANSVIDFTLEAANTTGATEAMSTVPATAVPVQANYRTNIYGALLTSPADFNVRKDAGFSTPDNDYPIVKTLAELKEALENGTQDVKIVLSEDMPAEETITIPASTTPREITIETKGYSLPAISAASGVTVNIYSNGEKVNKAPERTATRAQAATNEDPTIWAKTGSVVNIYGGDFTATLDSNGNSNSCIYSDGGEVNIYGGTFSCQKDYNGKYYVLNVKNGSTGKITVYAGVIKDQNPESGDDSSTPSTFVHEWSKVTTNANVYTVSLDDSKLQAALKAGGTVDINFPITKITVPSDLSADLTLNLNANVGIVVFPNADKFFTLNVAKNVKFPTFNHHSSAMVWKNFKVTGDLESSVTCGDVNLNKNIENVTFENIVFNGIIYHYGGNANDPGDNYYTNGLTVKNCRFEDTMNAAINISKHKKNEKDGLVTVENCVVSISPNARDNSGQTGVNGIYILCMKDLVVKNCVVNKNKYHGMMLQPYNSVDITGNTVTNSPKDGIKVEGQMGLQTVVIADNNISAYENPIRVKEGNSLSSVTVTGNTIDMTNAIAFDKDEPWGILLLGTATPKVMVKDNIKIGENEHWYKNGFASSAEGSNDTTPFLN